ncbi:citrate-binding protein-like [Magnolia sinica]|uniref:citrate-binding protein-like n=1 Tax=Magnolia sinica TaxID=86752 RepID=UPI002657B1C1|nr:citrate-binding protein-like [Magnolia sinica]
MNMKTGSSGSLLALLCLALLQFCPHQGLADPTDGFISLPLKSSSFEIQRPYNLPVSDRYSFTNGVHKLWVLSTDKPHNPNSKTAPRTEIRIRGYDYSSGVWQFEGYGYVPKGTTGVSIMQIFGGSNQATTMMMKVYDGSLRYYSKTVLVPGIHDRWFRLNVIHDVGAKKVRIFVDGVQKLVEDDHGGESHYFKFGVYAQDGSSSYMESRWKDIKVLKKT